MFESCPGGHFDKKGAAPRGAAPFLCKVPAEPRIAAKRSRAVSRGPCRPGFDILPLRSGALYVGATTDVDQRYAGHGLGQACRSTRLDPPVALICAEEFPTISDARQREAQVKRWSRAKKEVFADGDRAVL